MLRPGGARWSSRSGQISISAMKQEGFPGCQRVPTTQLGCSWFSGCTEAVRVQWREGSRHLESPLGAHSYPPTLRTREGSGNMKQ